MQRSGQNQQAPQDTIGQVAEAIARRRQQEARELATWRRPEAFKQAWHGEDNVTSATPSMNRPIQRPAAGNSSRYGIGKV